MQIVRVKPSCIALFATTRCTSACGSCCLGCNPKQGRSMTYKEMKYYVDKCIKAYPDTITQFSLTGGECMLLGNDIGKILKYATSKGLICSMVSNAFWATDYKKAYKTLESLQRKGLAKADFTTGEEHNQYVPWMNVCNACVAAVNLGIVTTLRIEVHSGTTSILNRMLADFRLLDMIRQKKLSILYDGWVVFDKKGNKPLTNKGAFQATLIPVPCTSLFQSIIINPYGEVYACCGIGACKIPQMRLGNIHQEPIKTIYERAFDDLLKIWLFMEGPQGVLKYIKRKTGRTFRTHVDHKCALCRIIFKDKYILPFLRYNRPEIAQEIINTYNYKAELINGIRTKRE